MMGNEYGPVRALVERAILSVAKPKDDKWDELVRELHAIRAEADALDAQTDAAQTWQPVEVQPPQHVREYVEQAMEGEYAPGELRFVLYNDTQAHDWLHEDADALDAAIASASPDKRIPLRRPQWPTGEDAAERLARTYAEVVGLPYFPPIAQDFAAVLARLNGDIDGE